MRGLGQTIIVLFIAMISTGIFSPQVASRQLIFAPKSLCALSYKGPKNDIFCSGILVSANTIVTAAHCFSGGPKGVLGNVKVGCGLEQQRYSGEGFVFLENLTASTVRVNTDDPGDLEAGEDFAFLKLDRPIRSIDPMRIPKNFEQFKSEFLGTSSSSPSDLELKSTVECRMSGFGVSAGTQRRLFVTSDHSPSNGLKTFLGGTADRAKSMVVRAWGTETEEMRPGDSGGGFYCRLDAGSPWVLVGVNVAVLERAKRNTGIRLYATTVSDSFQGFWLYLQSQWH